MRALLTLTALLVAVTQFAQIQQRRTFERVPEGMVRIEKPFQATIHYTPSATQDKARIVIDADWAELGPDTVVALLNQTTDRAAPRMTTTTTKGRQHLTLWLDDVFPRDGDLATGVNELTVEILSARGSLGRSPVFQIALR